MDEARVDGKYEYLFGIDGGGTGTRARVERADGSAPGYGTAGPSGLMHGADKAWNAVLAAIDLAFSKAGVARPSLAQLAVGFGLAGVHNKQWAAEFSAANPGFGDIVVETDAFSTLMGAHGGRPGAIIATGTGSVGEALLPDGTRREVGGWGFPSSDEASGAWLGLRAINYVQRVLDGRDVSSDFAREVIARCGGNRDGVFAWLARANQTAYAQLAPVVIAHAETDKVARDIMIDAGHEVDKIAGALDPAGTLPIALCGGLAEPLTPYLPERLLQRIVKPQADSSAGALHILREHLARKYKKGEH
jgi:glucosamine kinase